MGIFSHIISYIINEKHSFKFMVKAEVVPVTLEVNKSTLNLRFLDESLEMETSESIRIRNNGNAPAHFSWFSPNPVFRIEPNEGYVEPDSSTMVNVYYTPNGQRNQEDEVLDMKIRDGEPKSIKVTAMVNETRCEISPPNLNFGCLSVAQRSTIILLLKNVNPKSSAIFMIDAANLPPNLEITPLKGRILPDTNMKLEVTYASKIEEEIRSKDFCIKIRGGRDINVPITAKTIIPKVVIYENEFDFGTVTYGNSGTLTMTLENASPIVANLNLDLRENDNNQESEGLSSLKVNQVRSTDEETIIMEERETEDILKDQMDHQQLKSGDPEDLLSGDLSRDDPEEESADSINFNDSENSNYFNLALKPNRVYHFELTFTPLQPRYYKFRLPLTLAGNCKLETLARPIICHGIAPQFLIEPMTGVIEFKKKTISSIESSVAEHQEMSISNPDGKNA